MSETETVGACHNCHRKLVINKPIITINGTKYCDWCGTIAQQGGCGGCG